MMVFLKKRLMLSFAIMVGAFGAGAKAEIKAPGGFNVKFVGRAFINASSVDQERKNAVLFAGDFLQPLTNSKAKIIPTHNDHVLFSLDRAKVGISAEKTINENVFGMHAFISGNMNDSKPMNEIYGSALVSGFTILAGNTSGVEDRSVIGPADFACGSGGTGGIWSRVLNETTDVAISPGIAGDTRKATKLFIATPRVGGFMFSVSYTPSTQNYGEAPMNTAYSNKRDPFKHFDTRSIVLGINYQNEFAWGALGFSAVYLHAKTRPEKPDVVLLERYNTRALDLGCVVSKNSDLGTFFLGCEYILSGRSHGLKHNISAITPVIDQKRWDTKNYFARKSGRASLVNGAIGWSNKQMALTFSCLYSSKRTGFSVTADQKSARAIGRAYVLSYEYFYIPGVSFYAEAGLFSMRNPDWAYTGSAIVSLSNWEFVGVETNKARAILVGMKVQF